MCEKVAGNMLELCKKCDVHFFNPSLIPYVRTVAGRKYDRNKLEMLQKICWNIAEIC